MNALLQKPLTEKVNYPDWNNSGVNINVLREDLIHPYISGNKYRKLKYNLIDFKDSGRKTMLTFGGVFSNHLVATAASAKENLFDVIGIVRGEEVENDYLSFIRKCGMKLHFVSRSDYRDKTSKEFLDKITNQLLDKNWINSPGDLFILPEGGSNPSAVKGASEIMDEIPDDVDFIACACGTGATLAGISKRLLPHQKALGVSVLKVKGYFESEILRLSGKPERSIIIDEYHFGGYAKKNKSLLDFCENFTTVSGIPIESVYTGKLFFAIDDLIKKNYFKQGTKVTLIHTGGIFNFK